MSQVDTWLKSEKAAENEQGVIYRRKDKIELKRQIQKNKELVFADSSGYAAYIVFNFTFVVQC